MVCGRDAKLQTSVDLFQYRIYRNTQKHSYKSEIAKNLCNIVGFKYSTTQVTIVCLYEYNHLSKNKCLYNNNTSVSFFICFFPLVISVVYISFIIYFSHLQYRKYSTDCIRFYQIIDMKEISRVINTYSLNLANI